MIRDFLNGWKREHETELPEWFIERSKSLGLWRAPAKLAGLIWHWKENHFRADASPHADARRIIRELRLDEKHYGKPQSVFDLLEAWRKKDKHLYDWLARQRKNNERWRDDLYRNFAHRISRRRSALDHVERESLLARIHHLIWPTA